MMFAALLITLPTRAYSTNRVGGTKMVEAAPVPLSEETEKADLHEEEEGQGEAGLAGEVGSGPIHQKGSKGQHRDSD
jgi:hypothetical protein